MKINKHIVTVLYLSLSLVLCGILSGCELPLTIIGNIPAPEDTVTDFFDGICEGDYKKADACLSGSSIAMKNTPSDEFSVALMNYLQESYDYRLTGDVQMDGMEASQEIEFNYLDFDLLSEDLSSKSTSLGKLYIRTQDKDHTEIKDGVCTLTEKGAQSVAKEALDSIMEQPDKYYSVSTFNVHMRYQQQSWKIVMTDDLFEAIAGKYSK